MKSEFTEDMRRFEPVCRAMKKNPGCDNGGKKGYSLITVGMDDFGLTRYQCLVTISRARQFLEHVQDLDNRRKAGKAQ